MSNIANFIQYSVQEKPKSAFDALSAELNDRVAEKRKDLETEIRDSVFNEAALSSNFHLLAKKGDYAFAKDKKRNVAVVLYKGKEIDSGDFDQDADGWFLNHKSFGSQSNAFFSKAKDVVDHFSRKKITESKSIKE